MGSCPALEGGAVERRPPGCFTCFLSVLVRPPSGSMPLPLLLWFIFSRTTVIGRLLLIMTLGTPAAAWSRNDAGTEYSFGTTASSVSIFANGLTVAAVEGPCNLEVKRSGILSSSVWFRVNAFSPKALHSHAPVPCACVPRELIASVLPRLSSAEWYGNGRS